MRNLLLSILTVWLIALTAIIIGIIVPFVAEVMFFIFGILALCMCFLFCLMGLEPMESFYNFLFVILILLGFMIVGDVIYIMTLSEFWLHFFGIIKLFGQI